MPVVFVPRMADGDDPVEIKVEWKEIDVLVKTAELYRYRLIKNSGTVIDI